MDATAAWDDGWVDTGPVPVVSRSFSGFYVDVRDPVARALAITLGDADLAADAVDEAMARAYLAWSSVSTLGNPAGWVYRVGLNWARSGLRRRRWHPRLVESASVEQPSLVEPTLIAALERLSVRHRSVVVCRYLLGLSDAETCAALKLRPGTVRSSLHRALKTLREELKHLREEND